MNEDIPSEVALEKVIEAFDAAHISVELYEDGLLFYFDGTVNSDLMIAAYQMLERLPGQKVALIEFLKSKGK